MNIPSVPGLVSGSGVAASMTDASGSWGELGADVVSRLQAALGLGQATRLLQLATSLPASTLVIEHLRLREAVHDAEPLWAEVDAFSTSAFLALKALIGEQVTVRLKLADGGWRNWHGYVVRAAQLGADGGLGRYRLTLAAWTHWLTHRRDTRIFQDRTAQDVLTDVFRAWPQAHVRFDVTTPGPVRAICTQYRETDWAFACRLMAEEGWTWRVVHEGEAGGDLGGARAARHTLIVSDDASPRASLGALRFSRPDVRAGSAALAVDTITAWHVGQRVVTNAVTLAAWDGRGLAGIAAASRSSLDTGDVPLLEAYDGGGERRHADGRVDDPQSGNGAVASSRAASRMAALDLSADLTGGQGAVRQMAPGMDFVLSGHSLYGLFDDLDPLDAPDAACHVVTEVMHEARNNLGADVAHILARGELAEGSYANRFTAAPAACRLAPLPQARPLAPGLQTAVVMAAEGEPLHTDRDQRIRIQFGWQRGLAPLPGGRAAPHTPAGADTGHAPGSSQSGTWVRVAQGVAGPNWGAVFTPRAGSEVLVDFVEGDIDRPMVVGQLHNGAHDLPWPAGVDAGSNHPGTISGWHSANLDGQGTNQWLMDDACGQLRMRLASQGGQTGWHELTLGHVIQQSGQGGAGQAQRGTWLGEGFYGHTDGWAVVRAGKGLLLSTSARPCMGASVTGTQMDAAEAVGQLHGARQLGEALSQSARQQGAQGLGSHDATQAWQAHADAMDPQAQGRHPATVNGQDARKAQPGSRSLSDPVETFAKPLLHLDTPASAVFVTPASLSLFAGQDLSLTTMGDAQLTSAHAFSSVSGQTTSLYTHAGGIKAITANGPLSLRAHTDAQQIWSDQDLTVQSTTDEVRIQASGSITLTAGQSQIQLKGGDITFMCPGTWTVKAAAHAWEGGGSGSVGLMSLPMSGAAHVPEPISTPTLEAPRFSAALAFSDFPDEWLPFNGAKRVNVLVDSELAGQLVASASDEFTSSHFTNEALQVRYSMGLTQSWTIEEGIESAEFDLPDDCLEDEEVGQGHHG